MPTSTGKILKTAREKAGLTQKEVARLAFDDEDYQSYVSRYEADVFEPNVPNLRKLATVLNLSLGDFDLTPEDLLSPAEEVPA